MTRFVLDSTSQVPPAAQHAAGSTGQGRYLSRFTRKVATRAELASDHANGISVFFVFEDAGRPDHETYADGKANAEWAVKQMLDLGVPKDRLICVMAADYDPAGQAHLTDASFDGSAAVLGRQNTGPYGGIEVTRRQLDRGFKRAWQTYAWSGTPTQWDARAQVQQYSNGHVVGGVGCDYNRAVAVDFGQSDYHPPVIHVPDPHHYGRLTVEHYAWKGRALPFERDTAIKYDQLRQHPLIHRAQLAVLRADLKDLADHVYFEAHGGGREWSSPAWGTPAAPHWLPFHRGWRYQALIHRAQGKVVPGAGLA